jgi:alcohol dehydrogenase (cytochrome c)
MAPNSQTFGTPGRSRGVPLGTSSDVNSMPITWTDQGRQYVTVLSGLGGLYASRHPDLQKGVPLGGSVWTFALMPE